jgi:hypothetical protein
MFWIRVFRFRFKVFNKFYFNVLGFQDFGFRVWIRVCSFVLYIRILGFIFKIWIKFLF